MKIAPMIIVGITLVSMIVSIIFGWKLKIKKFSFAIYYLISSLGAILCLCLGFAGEDPIRTIFFNTDNINPLKILVIFLSCTSISIFLDKIGFFSYIAALILKKFGRNQTKLFFSFSAIIAILTIFTSNDILILTFTPFICYFAKHAKIDATPYIVSEFVCANVWSMFFFVDNPTNIYMCATFGISFVEYFLKMALPTLIAGVFSTALVYLLFMKKLKEKISATDVEVKKPNKFLLATGLTGLSVMVLLMALSNYIGLELWYIPLACALLTYLVAIIYLLTQKAEFNVVFGAAKSIPYSLIPFLLSMSVIVATLNSAGFIPKFASLLSGWGVIGVGMIAFLFGNVLNNIPMAMMFTTTLASYSASLSAIYGVIASSNICALLTPIGSLAGIMFMKILKQNEVKYDFKRFVGYGAVVSIPTILLALLMVVVI